MRVYLDDKRPTPPGWVACRWPDEVIRLLETGEVTELSLDHDLGDDVRGTGYDVLWWIQHAMREGFRPPAICIHSTNPFKRPQMEATVRTIEKMAAMID